MMVKEWRRKLKKGVIHNQDLMGSSVIKVAGENKLSLTLSFGGSFSLKCSKKLSLIQIVGSCWTLMMTQHKNTLYLWDQMDIQHTFGCR